MCRCIVDWGDPISTQKIQFFQNLSPCQLQNQYEKVDGHYRVMGMYCSAETGSSGVVQVGLCAAPYIREIDTSYNPANPLNISIHGEL